MAENKTSKADLVSQSDMQRLKSAVIFIPGTQEFEVWRALINTLEKGTEVHRSDLARAVKNNKNTVSDEEIKKLVKTCLEAIAKRQEAASRQDLINLCMKQMNAHNDTQNKLREAEGEIKVWQQVLVEALGQAIQKARMTAKTSKQRFLDGIAALTNSKNPDPVKLSKILHDNADDLRKFYDISKDER